MAESIRLRVEVDGDDIIVLMPGTQFRVIYRKEADTTGLVAHDWCNSPGSGISQKDFLARAWRVANDKARELGWIV
jgi:hypothetical protein